MAGFVMPITTLNEAELEEHFDRSSGPGGQNVNKVSTKVTLRHLPTQIAVSVQDTRSQAQNRELARERLLKALNDRESEALRVAKESREKKRRQNRKRPHGVKMRILDNKKRRGDVKKSRQKIGL
jgi:protein subunit release factor B